MKKYILSSLIVAGLVVGTGVSSVLATNGLGLGNTGNGAGSYNKVKVVNNKYTSVKQNNAAVQNTVVGVNQNSGGNKANKNTGGNASVDTGNTNATVTTSNAANTNVAFVNDCGCDDGVVSAGNSGNGADSTNVVKVFENTTTKLKQNNTAFQNTGVSVNQNSGNNSASKNTGGSSNVTTGDSNATVDVSQSANSNEAVVGGGFVF